VSSTTAKPGEIEAALRNAGMEVAPAAAEPSKAAGETQQQPGAEKPAETAAAPGAAQEPEKGQERDPETGRFKGAEGEGGQPKPEGEGKDEDLPRGESKRINKVVRQREEQRERAEAAEAERDRLKQEAEARKAAAEGPDKGKGAAATETKPADDPEPQEDQFEDLREYNRACNRWDHRQIMREEEAAAAKAAETEQTTAQEKTHTERVERVNKRYNEAAEVYRGEIDDYDTVLAESKVRLPGVVSVAIFENPAGPRIAYHIAKNPQIAKEWVEKLASGELTEALVAGEVFLLGKELAPASAGDKRTTPAPVPQAEADKIAAAATPAPTQKPGRVPSKAPAPVSPLDGAHANPPANTREAAERGDFPAFRAMREGGRG